MLDLAIAAAVLAASGVVPLDALSRTALLGELGLERRLRPVDGVDVLGTRLASAACRSGTTTLVNAARAAANAAGSTPN